jgi:periplasmic protein TonB
MKKTLLIMLLFVSVKMVYAQQPPPKTPKDPDVGTFNLPPDRATAIIHADTSLVYTAVQQEPSFPGGPKKWLGYINTNLKYPEAAKANNAEGKVFVAFVVERDGAITNPKVLRGIGNGCDEEAQRLLKNSPKWNPGMQNGKAVRVQYIIPVTFKLN